MDYVDRIDSLLESLLSRESLAEGDKQCRHCDRGYWAVWRCRDCSLGVPVCRGCMRASHRDNPFHRIERWTGHFFRSAGLCEVGTYLLVRHHVGTPLCEILIRQQKFLESVESAKDLAEQQEILSSIPAPTPGPESQFDLHEDYRMYDLQENAGEADTEPVDIWEMEDDVEMEETEEPIVNHYLQAEGCEAGHTALPIGTYLRVVHTNGIHDIAMVSCECRGNMVAGDLLAARLLPASFQRIRTLFTVQVMDHFRLCNLELKASAYQFYHLLRRLTAPMAPAAVVDLYREFRRMSRIWRWMKRLKWAGRANNDMPVDEVKEGELGIFCPACPQPGINIPDNWKDDPARYVLSVCNINSC